MGKQQNMIWIKDNENPNYIYGYLIVKKDFNKEKFQEEYNRLRYEEEYDGWEECLEELHKKFEFVFEETNQDSDCLYF